MEDKNQEIDENEQDKNKRIKRRGREGWKEEQDKNRKKINREKRGVGNYGKGHTNIVKVCRLNFATSLRMRLITSKGEQNSRIKTRIRRIVKLEKYTEEREYGKCKNNKKKNEKQEEEENNKINN